jgi:hypothetical protein
MLSGREISKSILEYLQNRIPQYRTNADQNVHYYTVQKSATKHEEKVLLYTKAAALQTAA